jgi:hypothetical protein
MALERLAEALRLGESERATEFIRALEVLRALLRVVPRERFPMERFREPWRSVWLKRLFEMRCGIGLDPGPRRSIP